MIEINETSLGELREEMRSKMSPKRYRHTLAVEDMVARLCALYCPQETELLRAAALLHDLTKELSTEEQIEVCNRYGLSVSQEDRLAPKTFHARTAAARIVDQYAAYAHPTVIDAVRWHTTGRAGMTLTEQLLYLADYIDESRTFLNCVLLRRFFWDADPAKMDEAHRLELLYQTLATSYDMTIRDLQSEGLPVAKDTLDAQREILERLSALS